jgi:hypothetical protein
LDQASTFGDGFFAVFGDSGDRGGGVLALVPAAVPILVGVTFFFFGSMLHKQGVKQGVKYGPRRGQLQSKRGSYTVR